MSDAPKPPSSAVGAGPPRRPRAAVLLAACIALAALAWLLSC